MIDAGLAVRGLPQRREYASSATYGGWVPLRAAHHHPSPYFTGIGCPRSTATAVMPFFGLPSISRSEYVR